MILNIAVADAAVKYDSTANVTHLGFGLAYADASGNHWRAAEYRVMQGEISPAKGEGLACKWAAGALKGKKVKEGIILNDNHEVATDRKYKKALRKHGYYLKELQSRSDFWSLHKVADKLGDEARKHKVSRPIWEVATPSKISFVLYDRDDMKTLRLHPDGQHRKKCWKRPDAQMPNAPRDRTICFPHWPALNHLYPNRKRDVANAFHLYFVLNNLRFEWRAEVIGNQEASEIFHAEAIENLMMGYCSMPSETVATTLELAAEFGLLKRQGAGYQVYNSIKATKELLKKIPTRHDTKLSRREAASNRNFKMTTYGAMSEFKINYFIDPKTKELTAMPKCPADMKLIWSHLASIQFSNTPDQKGHSPDKPMAISKERGAQYLGFSTKTWRKGTELYSTVKPNRPFFKRMHWQEIKRLQVEFGTRYWYDRNSEENGYYDVYKINCDTYESIQREFIGMQYPATLIQRNCIRRNFLAALKRFGTWDDNRQCYLLNDDAPDYLKRNYVNRNKTSAMNQQTQIANCNLSEKTKVALTKQISQPSSGKRNWPGKLVTTSKGKGADNALGPYQSLNSKFGAFFAGGTKGTRTGLDIILAIARENELSFQQEWKQAPMSVRLPGEQLAVTIDYHDI